MSTVSYVGQAWGVGTGYATASVATQPGDTVLAFLYIERLLVAEGYRADASSIAVQGGPWEVLDAGKAGRPGIVRDQRDLGVIYQATATGSSVSGGFFFRPSDVPHVVGYEGAGAYLRLLVYRGVRDVRLDAVRLPGYMRAAFPALYLPNATAGMVVRANIGQVAEYADPPHTKRPAGTPSEDMRVRLADASFPESRDVPSFTNKPEGGGSYSSDSWGWSISLAGRYAPAPPEIIEPAVGVDTTRDLSAGLTIEWLPAPDHGTQATYQLRKTTSGTVTYWTGTAWSSTETTLTGTTTSVTIPALANGGAVHEFAVRYSSTTRPDLSEWATSTVTGMAPPTVTQVRIFRWGSLDMTAGGTLATRTPHVVVNGDAAAGATKTGWRAVIRHGTTVLYDTGIRNTWWRQVPVEEALPNNLTGVYVDGWVYQNGTQPSATATLGPFSVAVPTPAAPVLGTQSLEHPVSGAPGVRLTLTWPAIGGTDPGDGHVRVVRNGEEMLIPVTPTQTTLDLDDYYAPSNEPTTYTASVIDNKAPENEGPSTTVTLPGPVVDTEWIVDALNPELAWPIILTEHEPGVRATRTTTWSPFTSSGHVVRPGVVADPIGSMTITTLDREDHAAVMDLLTSGRELLLRTRLEPDGAGDYWPAGDLRFRVTSDLSVSRVVKGKAVAWRQVAFEWAAQ